MRVFVYWNLHKGMWSVKDVTPGSASYGRVIRRTDHVMLSGAVGKVSQAGRERVLREGKKNVHAGIVGDLVAFGDAARLYAARLPQRWQGVTYNPYRYSTFVHRDTEAPFEGAQHVYLADRRQVLAV